MITIKFDNADGADPGEPVAPGELVSRFDPRTVPVEPWRADPEAWAAT